MTSPTTSPRLGWIGLGSMGLAMCTNLQTHLKAHNLPPLHYTNRTLSRGDTLKPLGAIACATVEEVVQNSDIIFISLSDDATVTATITTILTTTTTTTPHKILVDTTTLHPTTTSTLTTQVTSANHTYIAAPVFGSTPSARSGTLLIAVAGPASAITAISPFLTGILARKVLEAGPSPQQAQVLKTASNYITASLHYTVSEAHVLGEKTGLPAGLLDTLIEQNFGAYAHAVSRRMVEGAYCPALGEAPSSGLELGIKDVGHGVGVAREHGVGLEVGELCLRAMGEAREWGEREGRGRRLDSTAVYGSVRVRAGLGFESGVVRERDGGAE
ncbi:NAD(P)-binding protein [Massarina eburnea CBS 473.64]|uniref:NAD(P)-binding protein n=1 Tax=Massarina eburnea CBS 473.64 TaxID=1395130 RepID=A0A6A6RQR8_9PLEO|nr:NAD(P)-binding protein [Massarina eburnea CBS 473.64]